VAPADGAVLPVNAEGIEVRYTCAEPYQIAGESPFITYYGDRKNYGVDFATSAAPSSPTRTSPSRRRGEVPRLRRPPHDPRRPIPARAALSWRPAR
jgi:hypothetical protein